jgi:orotate phosphoribosyltransferase
MQEYQQKFIEFVIQHDILMFGDFTLKSGRQSPYFFNAGLFNTGSRLAFLAECYAAAIVRAKFSFDVLFGPAYKGIPLASATAAALYQLHGIDAPYCFNRKEAKQHGEGGMTVGAALKGRVLLIDDVITAGTAISEAAEFIQAAGAALAGIIVALDRQEKGKTELSTIQEIEQTCKTKVTSIINLQNIVDYLLADPHGRLGNHLDAVRKYRDSYGIA